MADWVASIPIGVIAYLGGILTKPLQEWISDKREEKHLRKMVYLEMAEAIGKFVWFERGLKTNKGVAPYMDGHLDEIAQGFGKFRCYEYACTKPLHLNQLSEATGIKEFYAKAERYHRGFVKGRASGAVPFAMLHCFQGLGIGWSHLIASKQLDQKFLTKLGGEKVREFVKASGDMTKYLCGIVPDIPPEHKKALSQSAPVKE